MKRLLIFVITILLTFNVVFSHKVQSETSFEDIKLSPALDEFIDDNTSNVLFLFGIICVGGCPIGNYIQTIKFDTSVVYFLPIESSTDDIFNFERGLKVRGKIIVANENTIEFVKLLAQKLKLEDYRENFVMELKKKKIVSLNTK